MDFLLLKTIKTIQHVERRPFVDILKSQSYFTGILWYSFLKQLLFSFDHNKIVTLSQLSVIVWAAYA